MRGVIWCGDKDVVHVYYDFACGREVLENCIHHGLECAWRVRQPKEHDARFVEPQVCFEGSLPLVSFDLNVVVSPADVEFCE